MKTNITVTVIIACVAMIVLSGIVTGMNTNVQYDDDLKSMLTTEINTKSAEVVEPKKLPEEGDYDFIGPILTGERIAKGSFQAMGLSAASMGFGTGMTGFKVTGDTGLTGFEFAAKYKEMGTSETGEKLYFPRSIPGVPKPPPAARGMVGEQITSHAFIDKDEVVEPKKISDKSISIWETGTKNIATQYFESMYNPSVVSPFSFEGMTGITPERKELNMRILGASKKNFEEAKVVLETAHEDIYEMSEVGGSFGNTLHTNDTELINEIFKQLDESALSTKAKKLEAVFNKFDKLWERARPSPELQRALDLSSDAGFIPTTGGAWAEQQRELTEAKKLEKLEDYLKVGLSVSLPNMQDVKLNPKL